MHDTADDDGGGKAIIIQRGSGQVTTEGGGGKATTSGDGGGKATSMKGGSNQATKDSGGGKATTVRDGGENTTSEEKCERHDDGEETNGYLRSVGIHLQLESTDNDSGTDESMEDIILSSARYFKREAAGNAETENLGRIYSFERKEREAVSDMSVSFAQEEAGSWEATEGRSKSNDDAELKMKTAEEIAEEEALRKATIQ